MMSLEDEVRAIVQDELAKRAAPAVATVAPDPPLPASESGSTPSPETDTGSTPTATAYDPQAPTADSEPAEPDTTGL